MLYNLSDKNKESDPKAQILLRRIMELRRTICKDSDLIETTKEMIQFYNDNQHTLQNTQQQDENENNEWNDITIGRK